MIPFYRFLEVGAFSMLNMMPFLLLAMYPFRRRLRFDKTTTRILVAMMAVIQIGLGCLAAFSPVGSETMSLLSTMIYASFYFFVVKDHLGRLGFVLLLFSNLGNLVSVCAKCMEGMIFGSIALEPYRWSMLVCMVIMHLVITVPVAFYVHKYFNSGTPIQAKSWNYLWIVPATFYLTWYYHLYFSGMDPLMVALDIHHAVFLLIINLGAFVVYHTAIMLLLEQKKNNNLSQKNFVLSLHNLQQDNLQKRIDETRRMRHDIRHHAYLLREYLESGKLQELRDYVEQYCASLPNLQPILYCQNYEVNSLLSYFASRAQQNSITMDVRVLLPEKIGLPQTKLSVLLGNLLENAIDACNEVTVGERKITVRGRVDNGYVFFEVSNNYAGTLKRTLNGDYLSTKEKGHGLGLDSVAYLAKEFNGMFEADSKDNVFRVSVMLQEQSDA